MSWMSSLTWEPSNLDSQVRFLYGRREVLTVPRGVGRWILDVCTDYDGGPIHKERFINAVNLYMTNTLQGAQV